MAETQTLSQPAVLEPQYSHQIYYTAKWRDGIDGNLKQKFLLLHENDYGCYRWDSELHYKDKTHDEQLARIQRFFKDDCEAFVFEVETDDYPHGASTLLMGSLLDTDIPVVIVDSKLDNHFGRYVGEKKQREHVVARNLVSHAMEQRGQLYFVKTLQEAIDLLPTLRARRRRWCAQ